MNKLNKVYSILMMTIGLSGLPTTTFATDSKDVAIPFEDVGGAINILLGAYNGAAKAVAENEGSEPQTIERSDLKPLEDTLQRYQNELHMIIDDEGMIDEQQLGLFLNQMQREHQGNITYDFTQAIHALAALNDARYGDNKAQQSLLQKSIAALVGAAKDKKLNQELNKAAPYLTALLQLSGAIEKQASKEHITFWQGEYTAQDDVLREFAQRTQAQSDLINEARDVAAKLKILYAEQALGSPIGVEAQNDALRQLQRFQLRVKRVGVSSLPAKDYDEILRPLDALGAPFATQHEQWRVMRQESAASRESFNVTARDLLDKLDIEHLSPEIKKVLLQRLNTTQHKP